MNCEDAKEPMPGDYSRFRKGITLISEASFGDGEGGIFRRWLVRDERDRYFLVIDGPDMALGVVEDAAAAPHVYLLTSPTLINDMGSRLSSIHLAEDLENNISYEYQGPVTSVFEGGFSALLAPPQLPDRLKEWAEAFAKALASYRQKEDIADCERLVSLLEDAMHWCISRGLDFDYNLQTARKCFRDHMRQEGLLHLIEQ